MKGPPETLDEKADSGGLRRMDRDCVHSAANAGNSAM